MANEIILLEGDTLSRWSGNAPFITSHTDPTENNQVVLVAEIKNLNRNIIELKEVVASLFGLLNSLTEEQRNLSEKQELMEMDRVYEKYGKPLEKEHKGKFACITPDGDFVIGKTSLDAGKKADEEGLEDSILFQIGNPGGGIDI